MNINLRKSAARGHADHDWLDSRHTFSFADYHDPEYMGFRSLRVINQDRVAPGGGFPMHPHRDMEIFSYVLEGELEHKDSMGNGRRLGPGDVQLMSAGSGVLHSEFNPSEVLPAHFLQIWIRPERSGLTPTYTEWKPSAADASIPKVLLISADSRDGSARIHQDADIWRVRLSSGQKLELEVRRGRGAWLQLITGELEVDGVSMVPGDGASTEDPGTLSLQAQQDTELLFFDLG